MTHAEWSADRETLVGLLTFLDQPWLTVNPPAGFAAKKETVRFVAAGVLLRELRSGTPTGTGDEGFRLTTARAIRVGGSDATPSLTLPSTNTLVGSGTLVITDRRVVVCGEANREWRFDTLVRVRHDQAVPDTWLQVGNRRRVSGWQGRPAEVAVVRFALARAVAESQGCVHALRGDLLAQLRQHDAVEPAAAVVASTKLAPPATTASLMLVRVRGVLRRLYTGRPGAPVTLRLLQGLGVTILTLALLASVLPDQQADVNVQSVAGSAGGSFDQPKEEAAAADAAAGRVADQEEAAADQAAADRARTEQAVADKAAADKAAAGKAAADKVAADKVAADKAAADKAAADKAAAEQAAARDAAERAAADRAAQQATADQAAAPQRVTSGGGGAGCTPEYPDFCIPAKPGDAYNCPDFDQKRFTARQPDPYRLDRDKDGVACES